MLNKALRTLIWLVAVFLTTPTFSQSSENTESIDMAELILHHISDAHEFHIITYTDDNGNKKDIAIALPIILFDNGLHVFSSKKLYHQGEVKKSGESEYLVNTELGYGLYHGKIYKLNESGELTFDSEGKISSISPLDFSITKNVFALIISALLLLIIMGSAAKSYKRDGLHPPKGIAKFIEPIVIFIRDDIAIANIGKTKYKKYMPYLLSVFFLIWFNSLLGLIPFFPGGTNLTGNISFTLTLSIATLILTIFSGSKQYWGHIFATPGVPKLLLPIMIPVEVIGIFTKPFALTVRLFANMTAGHIIVLALVGIIFTFGSVAWAGLSVPMALFINILELLVGFLQAFIFTMLSALFIGEAVAEHH